MLMSLVCTAAVSFSGLLLRSLSCSALRVLLTFTRFCYFQKQTSAGKKNDNKTRKKKILLLISFCMQQQRVRSLIIPSRSSYSYDLSR